MRGEYKVPGGKLVAVEIETTLFEESIQEARARGYRDLTPLGGETGARDAGKLRQEGKEYVVQDGDVLHFKFNV